MILNLTCFVLFFLAMLFIGLYTKSKKRKIQIISLEGGEGAGKTKAKEQLIEYLKEKGIDYLETREPGGVKIAEDIREVILDKENTDMSYRTEALLYAGARSQHLESKVVPALKQGKLVIMDRYIDSSLAYQGVARGLGVFKVLLINLFAINGVMPDITFYFDLKPEVGLERINKDKNREINRLDLEKIDFHNKVRKGYLILCKLYPFRIVKINADQTPEKVFQDIKKILDKYLK